MPSVVRMSPTIPVRSVPPVLMVVVGAAAGLAPTETVGASVALVAAVGLALADAPTGGALAAVGGGDAGGAAGAQAANRAVLVMPRMRSMAMRRLMRFPAPSAADGCLIVMLIALVAS